ncbi:MAG: UvrD-helicase domain-containing protein [Planctomycetes bacterium]|nr:UvrD-helicase domain-containing protein [Planctomycetota bacterium]
MPNPILQNLTETQLEAVTHIDGPMLVVAGAGSGKTRVVTRRIAYLIQQGVKPHQILAMTFTNKAASEMKARIADLAGQAPKWVGTFHSSCARFLRFDLSKLGGERSGDFTIYDDADQQGLIKQSLKTLNIDDKRFKPRDILSRISRAKSDMIGPDDFGGGSWDDEVIAKVYREYEKQLRKMNALDFDDLLVLTVEMLKKVPGLREQYLSRYRYILIDEYQDTNRTQYNLMKLLVGPDNNIHVTGDPDQSIYSWRGADYRNIMDFQKDYPNARLVRMEQNYRSTKSILAAANEIIKFNSDRIEKKLFTDNPEGEKLTIASLPTDREEANWVADKVSALRQEGVKLSDMSIFYRTNAQSRPFEEAMMSRGIPYQIIGGIRFYQRKEIKDFLAHLKVLVNPRDTVSLSRIMDCRATGVGPKTLAAVIEQADQMGEAVFSLLSREDFEHVFQGRNTKKLKDFAKWCHRLSEVETNSVEACVKQVLDESGLVLEIRAKSDRDPAAEDRLDNLQAFVNRASEFGRDNPGANLAQFLEDVALVADIDSWESETEVISLMTLHSAKGLEFPHVFIVGLEEGLLPHSNSESKFAQEEERRLFYVGITRAQEKVYITHAATRMLWGKIGVSAPSMFLDELPDEQVEIIDLANPFRAASFDDPWARTQKKGKFGRSWNDLDMDEDFDLDCDPDDPFPDDDFMADEFVPKKPAFRTGDHVEHPVFGRGKILSLSNNQAVIQFFIGGTKMLKLDVVPITKC